ncbi:MAG TPA: S41 family peptidase [Candidatus Saccharimonadales bacterium]|nr:S41 family peptidase [Candidatus Saccharimonadales bacterium]
MGQTDSDTVAHTRRQLWLKRTLGSNRGRLGLGIAVLAMVFAFGVEVGNGQIRLAFTAPVISENGSLPTQLDYSSVTKVYDALKDNYDGKLTESQLLDGMKAGLAQATNDPYTEYFTAAQAKDFQNVLNNSFSGIGAELGKDDSGNLIIVSPIKGFPADKAGLQPQDIIVSINGQDTTNMATDVAAAKIRGPKGTTVTLKIVRGSQPLTFTVMRDDIQLPSVTTKTLDGNIGYMQISSFADDTASLAEQAAQSFKQAGVKGVILDLRGNPGGRLDAAVDVSSLWLPGGDTVVAEKGTAGNQTFTATGSNPLRNIPTVVLIDGGSASASEITAGALHDNNAAHLIGVQSFGKGVVQQLLDLGDGSELKVTIASWYRPNGQNIQKKGITPDRVVQLSDADVTAHNDAQLAAAQAYLQR